MIPIEGYDPWWYMFVVMIKAFINYLFGWLRR